MTPFTAWDDYGAEQDDARRASTDEPDVPTHDELSHDEPRPLPDVPPVDHVRDWGCCPTPWARHEGDR